MNIHEDNEEEKLKAWNPMQEAYNDSEFNQYTSGPGENINVTGKGTNEEVPYLFLKRVPSSFTKNAINNICKQHGQVTDVRKCTNNNYFVDFASIADMEAAFRALQQNSFKMEVFIGKQRKKMHDTIGEYISTPKSPPVEELIDIESRNYRVSARDPARPHIEAEPFVSLENYLETNSLLERNDPKRHFLINYDSHELERLGLYKPDVSLLNSSKFNYRIGRAYMSVTPNIEKLQIEMSLKTKEQYQNKDMVSDEMSGFGKCFACNRICELFCQLCELYFCDKQCQLKVSAKHRAHCMAVIRNTTKPQLTLREFETSKRFIQQSVVQSANMPPNRSIVTIISIINTNLVFIRSKEKEEDLAYFKVISEVHTAAKNFELLKVPPLRGQIVVAAFEEQFNRAIVLNVKNLNKIKIAYIDYGNVNTLPMTELYATPDYYAALPRYAVPVMLKNLHDSCMTDEVRKFMYSYLDAIDVMIKYKRTDFVQKNGRFKVELIDKASCQIFNDVISELTTPLQPNTCDVIFREHLIEQLLPASENTDLVIMDNSLLLTSCLTCTLKECAFEIQKLQLDVQRYAESIQANAYAPRVNELCIAKYDLDGKWYRGRCLDLVGDGYPTIIFIDYGNIKPVHIKNIRCYPAAFTYPIFVADCEIEGLPEYCDTKLTAELEELLPTGSIINCERIENIDDGKFNKISLPDILKQLTTLPETISDKTIFVSPS